MGKEREKREERRTKEIKRKGKESERKINNII